MTDGTRLLDWADRLDGWARNLGAARVALALDYSPDPFLFRQLAKKIRAEEAGTETGPRTLSPGPLPQTGTSP